MNTMEMAILLELGVDFRTIEHAQFVVEVANARQRAYTKASKAADFQEGNPHLQESIKKAMALLDRF